jgi:hypothetical protein
MFLNVKRYLVLDASVALLSRFVLAMPFFEVFFFHLAAWPLLEMGAVFNESP